MRRATMARTLPMLLVLALFAGAARADDDDAYTGSPQEAAELFDEAEALREQGRWDDAATKYWEAVEADLRHFRAHVRYQEFALRAGDAKDEVVQDYKSFVEDYPKVFDLRLHLLRITKRPAERLPELEALAKERPDSWAVQLEIGRAQLALGQAAAAVKALTPAQVACPAERTDVLLLLADAEYDAGKFDPARQRLVDAVRVKPELFDALLTLARFDLREERNTDAAKRADEVLALRPGHLGAYLIKGEALFRNDDLEGALKTLVAARRASPDNIAIKLAYADMLGREEEGRDAAIALYGEVVEDDAENMHALFGWGWVLERQEKYEEAEQKYRAVVTIEPDSVVAMNSVGFCLYKQGRVSDAQVQFKKASDIDPDYAPATLNLGATYDAQAKYAEAVKIYEGFLKKNPKNLRAIVNCAFDYESLGAFPKALGMLLDAHEIQPTDPLIVVWIADNHYFQKKWKDAEKWYKEAIDIDEKSFFAWRGLGYTLGHAKRWEDAVKALEQAKQIKDDDLDVYLALGDIYMQEIEDLEQALKNFQEYVQRGGTDPAIQDLLIEIQKKLK